MNKADYRADIDGLRALAVLAVIAFHAFPAHLQGGFTGVDVFFVISGFLITGIILTALHKGTFTFRAFYERRIARIFPALIAVLAAVLVVGWAVMLSTEYWALGGHAAASAGFLANVAFWRDMDYFDTAAELKPLLHLWSLGVEEQFYLLWPPLLWLAFRWRARAAAVIATLALVSFAVNVITTPTYPNAAFYLPFARLWELALGALLAIAVRSRQLPARYRDLASAAGFLLVSLGFAFGRSAGFPGWWALLPTVGTAAMVAAGPEALVNRGLLSRRPLVAIGLISYPLYLWHWPALSFARLVGTERPGTPALLLMIGSSFLLAWLTYVAIERPIRFGTGPARRFRAPGLVVAMMVLMATGLSVAMKEIPPRYAKGLPGLSGYRYDHAGAYRSRICHATLQHPVAYRDQCVDADFADPSRVGLLLWGDSHAAHLYPGLRAAAAERGVSLAQFTINSCVPLLGESLEPCVRNARVVLDQVKRIQPDVVVLASTWDTRELERIRATVTALRALGVKQVIVVGPVPRWNRPLPRLLVEHLRTQRVGVPPRELRLKALGASAVEDNWLRRNIGAAPATYVSAIDVLCRDEECLAMIDGQPTAFDVAHLTEAASLRVAREVLSRVTRP